MPERNYEIYVRGPVDPRVLDELPGITSDRPTIRTVLYGADLDQAALYGILDRLQSLGLELVEVRRVTPRPAHAGDAFGVPRR